MTVIGTCVSQVICNVVSTGRSNIVVKWSSLAAASRVTSWAEVRRGTILGCNTE